MEKKILVRLILATQLLVAAPAWSSVIFPNGPASIVSVATRRDDDHCLLSKTTLSCIGRNEFGRTPPEMHFTDASVVKMNPTTTCVLDQTSVKCIGKDAERTKDLAHTTAFDLFPYGTYGCAIDEGKIKCWGDPGEIPVGVPADLKGLREIATGKTHACVIDEEGVKCWGDGSDGKTGAPKGLSNPRHLAAGEFHTCVIADDGVHCWGRNDFNQSNPPKIEDALALSAEMFQTCATTPEKVICWGNEGHPPSEPTVFESTGKLGRPGAMAAGLYPCAVDGEDYRCWGNTRKAWSPFPEGVSRPEDVGVSMGTTCVVEKGKVKCWGMGADITQKIPAFTTAKRVYPSVMHACATYDEGGIERMKCWGDNVYGELEVPDVFKTRAPSIISIEGMRTWATLGDQAYCWHWNCGESEMSGFQNLREFASSHYRFCAIDDRGLRCWGTGGAGGPILDYPKTENPRSLAIGQDHGCVIDENQVKCWGKSGEVPASIKNPRMVVADRAFGTCAIDEEGVKCWGSNPYGVLNPPPLKNPRLLRMSYTHACALDDEGLKCWGRNTTGEIRIPPRLFP